MVCLGQEQDNKVTENIINLVSINGYNSAVQDDQTRT